MKNTLLPDNLEINYRNNHYKHAQDVFNSIIWCSICNSDLKLNIIMNKKIMLHKKFLCLCCKDCFEKLSDSKNGCILCSLKTKLKTCKICKSNMCKRCIDSYYIKSKPSKNLKRCLGCSSSVLWSLRSQAAAVLKCFSLELGTRLLLNGEESENKQNLREFIINSAACDENFTQEDIYQIRVCNLSNLLNSKIGSLINGYQKLQTNNIEQYLINFGELCEKILVNTCSLLSDSQCLFNDTIIESLNNKIKSILISGMLFKNTDNDSNKFSKDSYNPENSIEFTKNKLHQKCTVLLEKLDENIENKYFLKKENNISKHTNKDPFKFKNKLQKTLTCQQENNLNPTFPINSNDVSQISLKECTVKLVRIDEKTLRHCQKYKDEIQSKTINHEYNIQETSKTNNLHNNKICECPILESKKFHADNNNCVRKESNNKLDSKPINNNIESNPKIYVMEKIDQNIQPKECIVLELEKLGMDVMKNVKHNKQVIKEKTANKTKIKMKITKKKCLKNLNSSKHKKIRRTKLINKILETSIYNCKN